MHIFAARNPAQRSACVVAFGVYFSVFISKKFIIMQTSPHTDTFKSAPEIKTLNRVYGKHGLAEICGQFVKNWLSQPRGKIPNHAPDNSADRIPFLLHRLYQFNHFL